MFILDVHDCAVISISHRKRAHDQLDRQTELSSAGVWGSSSVFTDMNVTDESNQNTIQTSKQKTFLQRHPNVLDVGLTLYKCYTKLLCCVCWEYGDVLSGELLSNGIAHCFL